MLLLAQHSALKIKYSIWSKRRAQLSISSINCAASRLVTQLAVLCMFEAVVQQRGPLPNLQPCWAGALCTQCWEHNKACKSCLVFSNWKGTPRSSALASSTPPTQDVPSYAPANSRSVNSTLLHSASQLGWYILKNPTLHLRPFKNLPRFSLCTHANQY